VDQPVPEPLDPLRLSPIQDLVVGAGLTWIVVARPGEWLSRPDLAPGVARIAPPARRAVFRELTSIDLDALEEVIVAGYEESTLYVLDPVRSLHDAERQFRGRLLHDVERKVYRPDATWTHGRTPGGAPQALSVLGSRVVAIEAGGTLRAKVALLFAIERLQRSPRALSLPDMERVLDALGEAPLRALAPGPFEDPWGQALHGMVAVCTAVGASIRPAAEGELHARFRLAGEWGDASHRAVETLLDGFGDLQRSSMGRVLHLHEPTKAPTLERSSNVVGLDVGLDGVKLLDGLYDLVAADVREILDWDAGAMR